MLFSREHVFRMEKNSIPKAALYFYASQTSWSAVKPRKRWPFLFKLKIFINNNLNSQCI